MAQQNHALQWQHPHQGCAGPRRFASLWVCACWMCQAPGVPGSYLRARGPAWSPARLRSQAPAAERARRLMPHALACLAARMPSAGARGSLCASAPHPPAAQARRVPAYQAGTRSESPQHWPASLLQTATFTSYSFHTQRRWLTSPLPGWASYPTGCKALRSSTRRDASSQGSSSSAQAPPHRGRPRQRAR